MNRDCVTFTAPGQVAIWTEPLPEPGLGQVQVQTVWSAISPGTELLVYRGQFPTNMEVDATISALGGRFGYPLKYGYASVGRVVELGEGVDACWRDRWVFAFQAHQSRYTAPVNELFPLPDDIDPQGAVFLPNMETAVNFVMDGAPRIGEDVLIFGQGIVGLLTTALLARFPLADLIGVDRYPLRRQAALEAGARRCLDPTQTDFSAAVQELLPGGADLAYEVSGSPDALDTAITCTGFAGRVVIGSWYGQKRANLELGGHFHRSRIRLISSQVSTLAPELGGRWTKARRMDTAWEMLRQVRPARWITHQFPMQEARRAYQLIDEAPEQTIQVVFAYPDG